MYRTYSYKDMPVPAKRKQEPEEKRERAEDISLKQEKPPEKPHKEPENKSILDNLKTDDIILIAIALVLLNDGCDDKLLLAAIAYVFISEIL